MSGAPATTNPSVTASWADDTGSAFTEGASDAALNGTTPVTLVAAPAAATRRVIKNITIANIDTAPVTITLSYNDNATLRTVVKVTLAVNDTWTTDGTYDSAGNLKTTNSAATTVLTVGSTTIGSGTTTRILYDNAGVLGEYTITGTGTVVAMQTSPAFTTPSLGVATATSINGNILTTGSSTYTGTAAATYTFPTSTATIARTDAAQTFTGIQTASLLNLTPQAISVTSNAGTADISHGIQNFTNSSAAAMTITLTTTSAVDGQWKEIRIFDFSGVAEGITWVNTENSTVLVPTTSNGSTTLPLSVLFQFNTATTKWRCVASA